LLRATKLVWLGLIPLGVHLYIHIFHPDSARLVVTHYLLQFTFLLFATLSLADAALKDSSRQRTGYWAYLAIGTGVWALAAILEIAEEFLRQPTYGTVADAFWFTGYVGILEGLWKGSLLTEGWKTPRALRSGLVWLLISVSIMFLIVFHFMPKIDNLLVMM